MSPGWWPPTWEEAAPLLALLALAIALSAAIATSARTQHNRRMKQQLALYGRGTTTCTNCGQPAHHPDGGCSFPTEGTWPHCSHCRNIAGTCTPTPQVHHQPCIHCQIGTPPQQAPDTTNNPQQPPKHRQTGKRHR